MSRSPYDEELYDFDYIRDKSHGRARLVRATALDQYGNVVRSSKRSTVNEVKVKLPPVLVGQSRRPVRSGVDLTAMAKDRRVKVNSSVTNHLDNGHVMNNRNKFNGPTNAIESGASAYYPYYSSSVNHLEQTVPIENIEPVYSGTRTPSNALPHAHMPRVPQVPVPPISKICDEFYSKPVSSGTRTPSIAKPHVHMLRVPHIPVPATSKICEESYSKPVSLGARTLANAIPHAHFPRVPQIPAPPTSQICDEESYSKSRRRVKYRNQELDQDVSIHKSTPPRLSRPKPLTSMNSETGDAGPASPVSEFIDDFDREVKEALEMENNFGILGKKMAELKNSIVGNKMAELKNECRELSGNGARRVKQEENVDDFLNELDDMLKTPPPTKKETSHVASSVDDGLVVPRITREPLKQWNGQTAKRGMGFKSKLKKCDQGLLTNKSSAGPII